MAAEEVTRTKLFVNTEWTAENCPATIESNGETITLQWGVNAFGGVQTAMSYATEQTNAAIEAGSAKPAFNIVLESDVNTGSINYAATETWQAELQATAAERASADTRQQATAKLEDAAEAKAVAVISDLVAKEKIEAGVHTYYVTFKTDSKANVTATGCVGKEPTSGEYIAVSITVGEDGAVSCDASAAQAVWEADKARYDEWDTLYNGLVEKYGEDAVAAADDETTSPVDIMFSGDGKFTFNYLFRGAGRTDKPKVYGQKVTIAEGTTLTAAQLDASAGQVMMTGNTVDVYGTLNFGMLRFDTKAAGTLNVYAGAYCSIGDLLTSGTQDNSINVYGDGEAFGATQFKVRWAGYQADYSGTPSSFSLNVSDYGVIEIIAHQEYSTVRDVPFGDGFELSLDNGKLIGDAADIVLQKTAGISMTGASSATMKSLKIDSADASVTLDANSSLIVSGAITVKEGATFTVDWSNMDKADWSKVNVVLQADSVSGTITSDFTQPEGATYTLVNEADKGQIYYYDAAQLSAKDLCVTSGEYEEGDLVLVNNTGYIYGTTAFGSIQTAYEKFYAAEGSGDYTIVLEDDGTEAGYNLTGTATNTEGFEHEVKFYNLPVLFVEGKNLTISGDGSFTNNNLTYISNGTLTIEEDATFNHGHHVWLGENGTLDVYGSYIDNETANGNGAWAMGFDETATINVYASAKYITKGCTSYGYAGTINVSGDGVAFAEEAQYQGTTAENTFVLGGKTETGYGSGTLNITDKGYVYFKGNLSLGGIGGIDANYQTAHSTGTVVVDNGKLEVGKNLNIGNAKGYGIKVNEEYAGVGDGVLEIKNGSEVIAKNINVQTLSYATSADAAATVTSSLTIDATSKLTYTGAIKVDEGSTFTVDFTGFEAAEGQLVALVVDGSKATGGITGNVDIKGELAEGWKVVQGNSIYAYDTTKVSTANLVVNADWADDGLAFGEIVTVNGVDYLWGLNAFGNLDGAIAAGAGNDAITITNVNESAYDFGGSNAVIGMDGLNWTLKGDWTNAAGIDVLGNLTITEGTVTSTSGTVTGNITVVGDGMLNERNYGISNQDNTLNLVITDATDAAVPLLKKNHGAGEYYKNTIINISAEDGTELKDSYKVIGFSPDNYDASVNYIVNFQPATTLNMDSALAKGGYNMVATYDGLYITKESYDMSEIRVNAAWAEMADGTEVEGLDGKTYVIGINAYGNANHAVNAALVNCDAENQITVRFESDFTSVNDLDFRYNSEMNIVLAGGKITEEVDGETVTRNVLLHTQGAGNSFDTWGSYGDLIIAEDLTVKTQDLTDGDQIRLYDDLHVYGEFHTHNLNRGTKEASVTVYKTGTVKFSYWMYQNIPNITVYGNGESFRETAQFHASTANANIDINMVDNNNEFNMNVSDYGFVQIGTENSSSTIGTTNVAEKYNINLADGKLYYYGGVTFGKVDGGKGAAVNLTLTGNSLFEQGHGDCVVTFTAAANADIAYTSRVDYGGAIKILEGANFAINFSDFSLETMGDDKFAVIVDGRDAKNGITGDVNYVGLSKLENLDWAVMNDGKNVYIYDEVFYGTDIYVNTDWAAMGSLTEVEGTDYVIGLNAFGSIDKAVAAGKNTVISLNVLGNGDYSAANISFAVEGEVVVNADGAFKADSITAAGKEVTADQMDIVSGSGNVSRAGTLNLGDGEDDDAALTLADGETLILSQMNVTENATIYGDGVRFSGKGATLTIADGKTLTLSLEQLLAIQGVEIVGAEGSVIVTGLEGITASQKAELIEEYGTIIKDLNEDTVAEADPITDVADLTEIDEGYVGDVGGTQGADKLVIGKGEEADYSGIDYNMRGGKNVATINADADFAIGDLTNVGTVDVKAGSKTGVTKATFGDITTSAGAGTVKVGNNAEFSADSIKASNLGGTNTVSFGNNVKGTVNGNITELKSLALGNGSDLNVSGSISSDNTTFASAALKVGNDSTITAGDVVMSSVTLGKNVTADLGGIYTAKAVTIGANNTVSIDSVDGVAANGAIKAGNDSVVEIAADVNMRGGKNSIVTGKSSDWTIGSDVMNVNTLTVTAAGNWAWNMAKTAYTLQRTTLNIGGDFLAGEGAAVLNFGNYSIVEIGGGILESDLGSSFKITVGSNAEVAVGDMIQSLNSLTIGNGVDFKTFTVVDGKAVADVDKAMGTTVFSAGKVTGTAGNDTIKIGNKADVTLGKVSLGAGNDTINIGKDSTFEAADVALGAGKNTVVIGANSWMNVDDISGVNKLTATGNLIAGDITGTDDFADVVTFNGNAEIGSIDLGTDAKGKMSDKLVIGKGAEVVINGGISNVEALTIGAGAKVSASESTIAAMKELGSAKGSKIDASVEFVALDDAADNAAGSTTVYDGNAEAWLGLVDGDTTDIFTLGDGTDLTGWAIEGEGIKVNIYTTTGDGNWEMTPGGITADENGKFALGNYMPAAGVTGVKVAVSFESENTEITKYNVTKLA